MQYYVYYVTSEGSFYFETKIRGHLEALVTSFLTIGKGVIGGRQYSFRNPKEFYIFLVPENFHISGFIRSMQEAKNVDNYGNASLAALHSMFKDVTLDYVNEQLLNSVLGKATSGKHIESGQFVSTDRIEKMGNLSHSEFDLKKLIKLLEELNLVYGLNLVYATGMVVRAIIDHIPPIFGFKNFETFASQYSCPGNARSFKNQMMQLTNMKDASDSAIHSHVRRKESIPDMIQFKKQTEIDALLQEIIRHIEDQSAAPLP